MLKTSPKPANERDPLIGYGATVTLRRLYESAKAGS